MLTPRFPRLESLLDARIHQLTIAHFRRAMEKVDGATPLREEVDLDFKGTTYSPDDRGKHHLAVDVCALANAHGGVIVIGIKADPVTAVASEMVPAELSDGERLRMQSIVAGNVFPLPVVEVLMLPGEANSGLYVIVVHPSQLAPHAVRQSNQGLQYYRREGSGNRILAESEVADLYRRRFLDGRDRTDRLGRIGRECEPSLGDDPDDCWLTLACVPEAPGITTITGEALRALQRDWLPQFCQGFRADGPFSARGGPYQLVPGIGRVELASFRGQTARPVYGYASFYSDGATYCALQLTSRVRAQQPPPKLFGLSDEEVVLSCAGMLRLAASHSVVNAGTGGDALVSLAVAYCGKDPLVMGHVRSDSWWHEYVGSRPLAGVAQLPPHTIDAGAVLSDVKERLVASRMVLTDLFHAFGIPEVYQVDAAGALRSLYWSHGALDPWEAAKEVPRVDERVD